MIVLIVIYALFCILVAIAGRNTRIGFSGALLFSIFMTPLLVAILIMLFQKTKTTRKVKKKQT